MGEGLGGTVVYRIHFTLEDLARTRVAEPPPLLELSAALRTLRERGHPVRFGAWRHAVRDALDPRARMVLELVPPGGWAPTFLTSSAHGSAQELLERVRATPRAVVRADLAHVAEWQPLPRWAHRLPDDAALLGRLCDALEHVHAVLLAPYWAHVTAVAGTDRGLRTRQAIGGGMDRMLASLHPRRIRWNPPVLEIAMLSGLDGDLHLGGRGLLLVPSVFGAAAPAVDIDAVPQPVLRYPTGTEQSPGPLPGAAAPSGSVPGRARSPLASLLGRTRAAVLSAIAENPGCSTKELAALLGIAPPSASEHATTLREARLIDTVRDRNTVLHSPTALGITLLDH
ncbi:MarR family transcriptional regulator [Streptomyces sp. NPDC054808]